jgi:hypothetical protein
MKAIKVVKVVKELLHVPRITLHAQLPLTTYKKPMGEGRKTYEIVITW